MKFINPDFDLLCEFKELFTFLGTYQIKSEMIVHQDRRRILKSSKTIQTVHLLVLKPFYDS